MIIDNNIQIKIIFIKNISVEDPIFTFITIRYISSLTARDSLDIFQDRSTILYHTHTYLTAAAAFLATDALSNRASESASASAAMTSSSARLSS